MKKICLVVHNPYPIDVRVKRHADALRGRGYEVFVIACRHDKNEPRRAVINGVRVYRVPPTKARASKLRYVYEYLVFFAFAFVYLNALDLAHKIDVVHINTLPDFLVFCAIIQKLKGRKIVLDMHEIMPEFFISKFSVRGNSPSVRLLHALEKASLRFADRVITVNDPLKEVFEKRALAGNSVEVVMNTVDRTVLRMIERRPHADFNCVYHGTLTDIYGVEIAIEGFSKACSRCDRLRFHIFGNGPEANGLKELARRLGVGDRVVFHGMVPHDDLAGHLAEMDLGVLASRKDVFSNLSFSNKLSEYVYFKIPVVHSDLDSVKFYFSDEEILFFKAGDSSDLAQKIGFAYGHMENMRSKAEAAFCKYSSMDWSVMAQRYLRVIEE